MKIFLGASDNSQLYAAKQWVADKGCKQLLEDLEAWAADEQTDWGECYAFVEVPLPLPTSKNGSARLPSKNGQVDLLVAFSRGAALCELKGHQKAAYLDVEKCVAQVRGQVAWVKELLGGKKGSLSVFPFLLLHGMFPGEMEVASNRVISNHTGIEIRPTGAHPKLKGRRSPLGPYYFPEALEERLAGAFDISCPAPRPGVHDLLLSKIVESGTELKQFGRFEDAGYYLNHVVPDLHVRHDAWYVAETRQEELREAGKTLRKARVVELVGAPGVGKSTLARDLIMAGKYDVIEVTLRGCRTALDLCRKVQEELHGDSFDTLGDETYVRRMTLEPYLFWVRGYDEESAKGINELFRAVAGGELAQGQSHWVVESRHPAAELAPYRHVLCAMDDRHISQIIERVEPGGVSTDPDLVVQRAKGNPGLALSLWRARDASSADYDDVGWFTRQLTKYEGRLLPLLCLAARQSPLGVTSDTFVAAAKEFGTGLLDSELAAAAASLVAKLEGCQLADVTRFNDETAGGLVAEILRPDVSLTIVNHVSPNLNDQVLGALDGKARDRLQDALHYTFLNTEYKDTLSHVTLAINLEGGDLEPFFRSSFRYTSLGAVVDWIDYIEWVPPDRRQNYLLKALRALRAMRRGATSVAELGRPDESDPVQRFACNFVKSRAFTVKQLSTSFRLNSFLADIARENDPDLSAAVHVSLSLALQNSNRPEDTWRVLRDLPEKYPEGTTAKILAVQRTLDFLNATKSRQKVVGDEEAHALISGFAKTFVEEGLRVENLQVVCEGIFHYVRAQEMRAARTSRAEVLSYHAALKFVEDAPLTRARHRLRIMLTQGSIHRHYCGSEGLSWDEFREHFEEGFERYARTIRSALAQGHTLHMLNAACYIAELCVKSFLYRGDPQAAHVIAAKVVDAVRLLLRVEREVEGKELWGGEEHLYLSFRRSLPALMYVRAVTVAPGEMERKEMTERFTSYLRAVENDVRQSRMKSQWHESRKRVGNTIRIVNNALAFGAAAFPQNHTELLPVLRPPLSEILRAAESLASSGWVKMEWEQLAAGVGAA